MFPLICLFVIFIKFLSLALSGECLYRRPRAGRLHGPRNLRARMCALLHVCSLNHCILQIRTGWLVARLTPSFCTVSGQPTRKVLRPSTPRCESTRRRTLRPTPPTPTSCSTKRCGVQPHTRIPPLLVNISRPPSSPFLRGCNFRYLITIQRRPSSVHTAWG
jgi:hypothetical protein